MNVTGGGGGAGEHSIRNWRTVTFAIHSYEKTSIMRRLVLCSQDCIKRYL